MKYRMFIGTEVMVTQLWDDVCRVGAVARLIDSFIRKPGIFGRDHRHDLPDSAYLQRWRSEQYRQLPVYQLA